MNIIDFISHFPTEESCEDFLKAYREKCGIYCKKPVNVSPSNTGLAGLSYLNAVSVEEELLLKQVR